MEGQEGIQGAIRRQARPAGLGADCESPWGLRARFVLAFLCSL